VQGLKRERLWFTGHSLGGALAMLCAHGWDGAVEGVYTFGQPRAGDAAFRNEYNERLGAATFRVVHGDDIVPRVPWVPGHYYHAGHEVFYPMDPAKGPVLDRPWWARLAGEVCALVGELRHGRLALLDDHHMRRYLALYPDARALATHLQP
jgi:triacylglycerol lipase